MWAHPSFVVAFAYFSITLLGGITAVLLLRAPRVALRLRAEPELVTFAATIVLLTVVAGYDHSRYLVFALPVALVSVAAVLRDAGVNGRRRILTVMTLITVWTQRPFEAMTADSYFLDWFPLYRIPGLTPVPPDVLAVWMPRLVTLVLLLIASFFAIRQATRPSVART